MAYADALRQEVFNPSTAADLIEGCYPVSLTSYTPSFTSSDCTISSVTSVNGKYCNIGNIYFVSFYGVLSVSSHSAFDIIAVSLPADIEDYVSNRYFVTGSARSELSSNIAEAFIMNDGVDITKVRLTTSTSGGASQSNKKTYGTVLYFKDV